MVLAYRWAIPGLLAGIALLLAALRALWFYGRPRSVRRRFLWLAAAGAVSAGLVAWRGGPDWAILLATGIGLVPVAVWVLWKWLSYEGPPPGLVRAPAIIEELDDAVTTTGASFEDRSR